MLRLVSRTAIASSFLLLTSLAHAQTTPPPAATTAPAPVAAPAPAPVPAAVDPAAAPAATTPPPAPGQTTLVMPGTSSPGSTTSLKGASLWGILPWNGVGIGARFMLPFPAIKPLLVNTTLRDSFALEFGADYLHWSYSYLTTSNYGVSEFLPVVGMMWNVWLNDQFIVYPKFELGYEFAWVTDWNFGDNRPSYGGFFWNIALGAMYKLNNGLTLRAEAGYAGLKLGVGWLF